MDPCRIVTAEDIRTAAQPIVVSANTISLFMGFGLFVNMLVSTQLLQTPEDSGYGMGLDGLHAGLWMAPSAVAFGLLAPFAGWVTRRFGPELAIAVGGSIMADQTMMSARGPHRRRRGH